MEGAKINRSLLALANCINALGDKNKKGFFVPYRVTHFIILGFKINTFTKRFFRWKLQNCNDRSSKPIFLSILIDNKHVKIRKPCKKHKNKGNNEQKTGIPAHK